MAKSWEATSIERVPIARTPQNAPPGSKSSNPREIASQGRVDANAQPDQAAAAMAASASPDPATPPQIFVHATAIALGKTGVLLLGPSGSGKSDLALRLIDDGARLIADDQVMLSRNGERLIANPPPVLAGRIEARGIGILQLDGGRLWRKMPMALAVELVPAEKIERLPEPATREFLGVALKLIRLNPFEASAVAKLKFAVETLRRS
jgi:HPr kinase/phosphorylase